MVQVLATKYIYFQHLMLQDFELIHSTTMIVSTHFLFLSPSFQFTETTKTLNT